MQTCDTVKFQAAPGCPYPSTAHYRGWHSKTHQAREITHPCGCVEVVSPRTITFWLTFLFFMFPYFFPRLYRKPRSVKVLP